MYEPYYSKDDMYISRTEFLEDSESKDNFVKSKEDFFISRTEFLEDAVSKDDFNI